MPEDPGFYMFSVTVVLGVFFYQQVLSDSCLTLCNCVFMQVFVNKMYIEPDIILKS